MEVGNVARGQKASVGSGLSAREQSQSARRPYLPEKKPSKASLRVGRDVEALLSPRATVHAADQAEAVFRAATGRHARLSTESDETSNAAHDECVSAVAAGGSSSASPRLSFRKHRSGVAEEVSPTAASVLDVPPDSAFKQRASGRVRPAAPAMLIDDGVHVPRRPLALPAGMPAPPAAKEKPQPLPRGAKRLHVKRTKPAAAACPPAAARSTLGNLEGLLDAQLLLAEASPRHPVPVPVLEEAPAAATATEPPPPPETKPSRTFTLKIGGSPLLPAIRQPEDAPPQPPPSHAPEIEAPPYRLRRCSLAGHPASHAAVDDESGGERNASYDVLVNDALSLGVSAEAMEAASAFDERQEAFALTARLSLGSLIHRPTSRRSNVKYECDVERIRRNRFLVREAAPIQLAVAKPRRKPRRARWRLDDSLWKPRAVSGNSRDYFETHVSVRRLFGQDWAVALRAHGLAWFVLKASHPPSQWKSLPRERAHSSAEVGAVGEVLWRHHRTIYGAFDYYAALHSSGVDSETGEADVFNLTFNAFLAFVTNTKMVSKRCNHGVFQAIWSVVNASDQETGGVDRFNSSRTLNRQEWLQALVRCAIAVHDAEHPHASKATSKSEGNGDGKAGGKASTAEVLATSATSPELERQAAEQEAKGTKAIDVADAVDALIERHILPALPSTALQDSNAFRRRLCYVEKTCRVLEANKASLDTMFMHYAEANQVAGSAMRDDSLMSVGEWLDFVGHMGLLTSGQLSVHTAKLIFLWSRIRSAEEGAQAIVEAHVTASQARQAGSTVSSAAVPALDAASRAFLDRTERRLHHLDLEDFYEAIVRLATVLALPTALDVEEAGARDAGDLLMGLQRDAPREFERFLVECKPRHKHPDGEDWEKHTSQPVWLCIDALLSLLIRTVEYNTSALHDAAAADGVVQASEIKRFLAKRSKGDKLTTDTVKGCTGFEQGALGAALEAARTKHLFTVAAIKLQMARRAKLARDKLKARREMMRASLVIQLALRGRLARKRVAAKEGERAGKATVSD